MIKCINSRVFFISDQFLFQIWTMKVNFSTYRYRLNFKIFHKRPKSSNTSKLLQNTYLLNKSLNIKIEWCPKSEISFKIMMILQCGLDGRKTTLQGHNIVLEISRWAKRVLRLMEYYCRGEEDVLTFMFEWHGQYGTPSDNIVILWFECEARGP